MIRIDEKTFRDIAKKVGPEKMKAVGTVVPSASENEPQAQQPEPSNIIGTEHIAQSERDGVSVKDISMSVFERNNLGKNIVFTEEKVVEENKRQIIQLHNEICEYMKVSLEKAMKIGELLFEQKKRIIRGGFIQWEKKNMPFTVRTGQNYMKLFCYKEQLQAQNITSLCDAYAFINGEAMPNEVISATDSTDVTSTSCSIVGSTVSQDGFEFPKRRPKGLQTELQIDRELVTRMANEECPFEGLKGKYLKIVVDVSNFKKTTDPKLLGDFLYNACDYLKPGGKLIMYKKRQFIQKASIMTKNEYIKRIICEHWFGLVSWKGRNWEDSKKQTWLSGMHRAWNILYPSDKIEPLEIVTRATIWTWEEAEQWYTDYLSEKEVNNGSIEYRWSILDLQ